MVHELYLNKDAKKKKRKNLVAFVIFKNVQVISVIYSDINWTKLIEFS